MTIDPIKLSSFPFKSAEGQGQISVPVWFLEVIGGTDDIDKIQELIDMMQESGEETTCKHKSIHLAKIRIKYLKFLGEK